MMNRRDALKTTVLATAACATLAPLNSALAQAAAPAAGPFTLGPLPYSVDTLEPYIDARTMEIHHDKHHAAYVNNLNKVKVTALRNVKEPFSCLSHMLGVLLAIPGLVYLVAQSDGDPRRTVGFCIYGLSLIVLYSASSLYHGLSLSPRWEDLLRRFDHIAIFVLIAGTYTPICLITLHGRLAGVCWESCGG